MKLRKAPCGRRLARQQELLHPPVQKLGDEQHVRLRTRHLVNPAELFQAFPRPPEHSQKLAVERQLVDAAGKTISTVKNLVRRR